MARRSPDAPTFLRCEYLVDPVGISEAAPRLSWLVSDERRGARQSAYEIRVASDPDRLGEPDVWNSGKVRSAENAHVVYAGPALASRQRVWWTVRTFDAAGKPSPWATPAFWEMGLLSADEWVAKWVGLRGANTDGTQPCAMFRRGFDAPGKIARARAYVAARGICELHLNGRRVSEDCLGPGWTDYNVRIPCRVYDVTDQVRSGRNAVGAILADGWYCGFLAWGGNRGVYGKRPSVMIQLEIVTTDGKRHTVATDGRWRSGTGPILSGDLYKGETYDARMADPAWATAGFDDRRWKRPEVVKSPPAVLSAAQHPPVRAIQELRPVKITQPARGVWIFDLGQNMVGRVRLRVKGRRGQTVTIRHAEMLNEDGTIYTENLRSADATDRYTLAGGRTETYEPRFTFHGFRYVELTGYPGKPTKAAVTGVVLHSQAEPTGEFECSDALVNRLQQNILWGQKGNFLEVHTDCPQRNERLGWTGDAQVFIRTACFNLDVAAFFTKWQTDLADSQTPEGSFPDVAPDILGGNGHCAWADAGVICPWTVYLCYGDVRILERHYDSMAAWVEYMRATSDGLIRPNEGYGDWLATDAVEPGRAPTPKDLIGTAYFAYCCTLMEKTARVLKRPADVKRFAALGKRVRKAFRDAFVTPAGRIVGHTQTGYALALAFDLLEPRQRPTAVKHFVAAIETAGDHLSTGFVGTPLLAPVLTRFGRTDVAYRLLMQDTYPSWLYSVKIGATTMWERWNSWSPDKGFGEVSMNSFNHYAYGAIGEWLYATVAGIGLDESAPGGRHLVIHPRPGGGLRWAKGSLRTMFGRVSTEWRRAGKRFTVKLTVPPNTAATVILPASRATESGRSLSRAEGVTDVRVKRGQLHCALAAGTYVFEATD